MRLLRSAVDLIGAANDGKTPAAQSMLARLKAVYMKVLCRAKEVIRNTLHVFELPVLSCVVAPAACTA